MKQRIECLSPVVRRITVHISADEVDAAFDEAARQHGSAATAAGVGAGNATGSLNLDDTDAILTMARQSLLDAALAEMTDRHGIQPVNRVAYEEVDAIRGQDCTFVLQCEALPPISLPARAEELSVKVREPLVAPEAFHAALLNLRRSWAKVEDVTELRPPRDGELVQLDLRAVCDEAPVPGMNADMLTLRLGDESSEPGMAEITQVARRLSAGQTGTCVLPCPADYPDARLRGRDITLTVSGRSAVSCCQKRMTPLRRRSVWTA